MEINKSKMKATLLIGGKSDEHDRHEADFYPTPSECTHALMKYLVKYGLICKDDPIWEPACGNGAMSEVLKKYVNDVRSSDIREDTGYSEMVEGPVDFLRCDLNFLRLPGNMHSAIITNPPFNLSTQFIQRCHDLKIGLYAMLLKSQYWHSQSRLKIFEETKPTYIMPLTWRPNFAPNRGNAPTMDVCWTVWVRGQEDARYIPLTKPAIKKQMFVQSTLL